MYHDITMRLFFALLLLASQLSAAGFRAGLARVNITPDGPIWLSGYASRNKASEGVYQELFAKALALEDSKGYRVVIVSIDLIGIPRALADEVAARVQKEHALERSRLLLNASHTHTGPVVRSNLITMWDLSQGDLDRINGYGRDLADKLVKVTADALQDLAPAKLAFGEGKVSFAINRREPTPTGIKLGLNPKGPVDHAVPVIEVRAADGKLRGIVFGYACHNTTLGGDIYQVGGDYAGKAQAVLEEKHAGAAAMFLMLCGGDANPNPRGQMMHVNDHGTALAGEVSRVLGTKLSPLSPRLRSAFQVTDLPFAVHTREQFEKEATDKNLARARRAQLMLKAYDDRTPVTRVPYPVQAIRFDKRLTILALGGEVVVDYDLRAKREYPKERLIVAGYSNDVMCYIPSKRVLEEGGYEPDTSMIYYAQPGPFAPEVEQVVMDTVRQVMSRVGAKFAEP